MNYYLKDPGASIDYSFDWNAGYLSGQTVTGSVWQTRPIELGGVAVISSAATAVQTSALVNGGVPGHVYHLTNSVTFSDGRSDERSVVLRVEDR